jgi:hypothetical protein
MAIERVDLGPADSSKRELSKLLIKRSENLLVEAAGIECESED